jgi:hypothetical protein
MGAVYLRKYNVVLASTTAGSTKIRLSLRKAGVATFATGSDWSPASGEVKVSKDGGSEANIGTLPSYSNGQWEFVLSATELSAAEVHVRMAATAIDDEDFVVETFGNASAMFPHDYTDAARMGVLKPPVTLAAGDVSGNLPADQQAILGTALSESTGGWIASAFKKFFNVGTPTGTVNSLPAGVVATQTSVDNLDTEIDAEAVKTDSLLARLGAFAGSGINTVKGFFLALMGKTATKPSDIDNSFDPATDSNEAIRDQGDAAWTTGTGDGGGGGGGSGSFGQHYGG